MFFYNIFFSIYRENDSLTHLGFSGRFAHGGNIHSLITIQRGNYCVIHGQNPFFQVKISSEKSAKISIFLKKQSAKIFKTPEIPRAERGCFFKKLSFKF